LTGKEAPIVVVNKIQRYLDEFAVGAAENLLGDNVAVALAALWGNAICEAFGWQWIVPVHGHWRSLGVSDRERRHLALPFNLFHEVMHGEAGGEMPAPLTRFNAIAGGTLPPSDPGSYMVITS
jgi:hypothetical protein